MAHRVPLYKNRSLRTIFLAVVATVCFVGSAIFIFDADVSLMWEFFLACLLGLAIVIFGALLFVTLKNILGSWLNK